MGLEVHPHLTSSTENSLNSRLLAMTKSWSVVPYEALALVSFHRSRLRYAASAAAPLCNSYLTCCIANIENDAPVLSQCVQPKCMQKNCRLITSRFHGSAQNQIHHKKPIVRRQRLSQRKRTRHTLANADGLKLEKLELQFSPVRNWKTGTPPCDCAPRRLTTSLELPAQGTS